MNFMGNFIYLQRYILFIILKLKNMALVKVIEVISSSTVSIDDAVRNAVAEASKTIRNIDSVYVKDIKAHVKDGKVTTFGVICNLSFRIESENGL